MIKTCYGESVMTAQGRQKLPIYKYQGGDDSLIYKYITGKLAQVLVDNVYPETLAYTGLTQAQPDHIRRLPHRHQPARRAVLHRTKHQRLQLRRA